jgi:hypothetical protein
MIALSTGLTGFSGPVLLVVLIILVLGALEGERVWTRSRRRRRLAPGVVAYLLDGLVIVGMVLALVGVATLFVEGLNSMAVVVGGVINGERVGLLIVGMALALGLALVLARAASGRRTAQDVASASTAVAPPTNVGPTVAEARLAVATEPPVASAPSPYERFEAPPLAMMQERWQPSAASAVDVPTSFLDLKESRSNKPARSRFALASTLLVLALMVMVVSSALLFRHQLMGILAGMEASYGGVANATSNGSPPSLAAADTSSAAADVGAAAASVVSAPTAVGQAAALPAGDAQAAEKRVKSNGLNLRAQPGTDQQVVAVLAQGDLVTVFNDARLIQGATWVKVRAGEFEGWVDQRLLE